MRIAVLFDGAGLARLGLEKAGHKCVGVELDPAKHYMSKAVGSGSCVLGDALTFDLAGFDAVWASPPCQEHSLAKTQGPPKKPEYGDGTLLGRVVERLVAFDGPTWIENVISPSTRAAMPNAQMYNAAQFLPIPIQNRNRLIGGVHPTPRIFTPYRRAVPGICPCISASEYLGCASDTRRASRFYGRKLTVAECAYHQGFSIPFAWRLPPEDGSPWTPARWRNQLYEAIGNGVPVYMAEAFGRAIN